MVAGKLFVVGERRPLFWEYRITSTGLVLNPDGTVRRQYPTYQKNGTYWFVVIRTPKGRWRSYFVHRLVAHAFAANPRPDIFTIVDHIDRNPSNNDITNLRWLNQSLNMLNNDAKGAYYDKRWRKWNARLCYQGKKMFIGAFKTYEKAHAAYVKTRDELFSREYTKLCETPVACANIVPKFLTSSFESDLRSPTRSCC